jgi:hypothetical protein
MAAKKRQRKQKRAQKYISIRRFKTFLLRFTERKSCFLG